MTKSEIQFGDEQHCRTKCGQYDWCKSFDFCRKDPKKTWCHLKNINRLNYTKSFPLMKYLYKETYEEKVMGFNDYWEDVTILPSKIVSL